MDLQLHYIEKGSGTPLLLLHGNGEDSSYFEHQIQYFSRHYRVIAIDTRGHGKSERGEKPFTIQQFSEDLHGFMNQKGITKAVLLGFSDGGNIAMTYALSHPERVQALILNGANLNPKGVKRSVQYPIEIGYHIAKCLAKHSKKAKANMEMLQLMVKEPNIQPSELTALSMPTLVIAGTKDMIKDSHTRLIAKSIHEAALALVPGDHFIANKKADAFNREVESFLHKRL